MLIALLAAGCVLAIAPVPPEEGPEKVKIVGNYDAAGKDISGKDYTATVAITEEGDAYRVEWTMPDGGGFLGIGIRSGKTLSVSWAGQQQRGVIVGIMVYEIQKGGTLEGKWTMLGSKGVVRTETLKPAKE